MKPMKATDARDEWLRLQLVLCIAAEFVVTIFAPRLLELDPGIDLWPPAVLLGSILVVVECAVTLVIFARVRPTLEAIVDGRATSSKALVELALVPSRTILIDIAASFVALALTFAPRLRPSGLTAFDHRNLAVLTMSIGSLAALLGHALLRRSVSRFLARALTPSRAAPILHDVERDGIDASLSVVPRVALAIAAPIGFVALGATLLLVSHERRWEAELLELRAATLARSTVDAIDGDLRGADAAARALADRGVALEVGAGRGAYQAVVRDRAVVVHVPLERGAHATVELPVAWTTRSFAPTLALLALTAIAGVAAGLRAGRALARDLDVACHALGELGTEDALAGRGARANVRFSEVDDLLAATRRLATVLGNAAIAREAAAVARARNESTRARFLATMSHDLKAPLNAILGFTTLASRAVRAPAQQESLSTVERSARSMLLLVETILAAARLEAGSLALRPALSDLVALLRAAQERVDDASTPGEILRRPLRVRGARSAVLPLDTRWLELGLTALLTSIRRIADDGPPIDVDVGPEAHGVRVTVTFSPVTEGSVIEPLELLEQASTARRARRLGGLGLGLDVARSIVIRHGGTFTIEDRGEDFVRLVIELRDE
jgi:signal transduction histidine kinase